MLRDRMERVVTAVAFQGVMMSIRSLLLWLIGGATAAGVLAAVFWHWSIGVVAFTVGLSAFAFVSSEWLPEWPKGARYWGEGDHMDGELRLFIWQKFKRDWDDGIAFAIARSEAAAAQIIIESSSGLCRYDDDDWGPVTVLPLTEPCGFFRYGSA